MRITEHLEVLNVEQTLRLNCSLSSKLSVTPPMPNRQGICKSLDLIIKADAGGTRCDKFERKPRLQKVFGSHHTHHGTQGHSPSRQMQAAQGVTNLSENISCKRSLDLIALIMA